MQMSTLNDRDSIDLVVEVEVAFMILRHLENKAIATQRLDGYVKEGQTDSLVTMVTTWCAVISALLGN
jgi:hypothetical protein